MGVCKLRSILLVDTGWISRIPEKEARIGRFRTLLPEYTGDKAPEELRLTTTEDCLSHEIAFCDDTDDGPHVIFPSQCQEIYDFLCITSTCPQTIRTRYYPMLRSGFVRARGSWKHAPSRKPPRRCA
jgi:hypothetical protein